MTDINDSTPEWHAENLRELIDRYPDKLTISVLRDSIAALLDERVELNAIRNLAGKARVAHSSVIELVDPKVHTIGRLWSYLRAHGYKQTKVFTDTSRWERGELFVFVPDTPDAHNYDKIMANAIQTLALQNGTGELIVLAQIAGEPKP